MSWDVNAKSTLLVSTTSVHTQVVATVTNRTFEIVLHTNDYCIRSRFRTKHHSQIVPAFELKVIRMADQSPLTIIVGAERYIRSQVAMGITTREDATAMQLRNVLELIRTATHISQAQGCEALEHLQQDGGTFNAAQRKDLAAAVSGRQSVLQDAITNTASTSCSQTNLHCQKYFPDWLWRIIMSGDTVDNKLIHVAEFWADHLGLLYPCEHTKRLAVAIVQVASNQPVDADLGYRQLHDLQGHLVRKRGGKAITLRRFPDDPTTFWNQYPQAYTADNPPAPCRVDAALLFHRNTKTSIPARSSNKRVTVKQPPSKTVDRAALPSIRDSADDATLFRSMMAFMLQGTAAPTALPPQLPNRDVRGGAVARLPTMAAPPRIPESPPRPIPPRSPEEDRVAEDSAAEAPTDAVLATAVPSAPGAVAKCTAELVVKPMSVGGLRPNRVLSAPPQTDQSKLATIRANIAAAVKAQKAADTAVTEDDDAATAGCAPMRTKGRGGSGKGKKKPAEKKSAEKKPTPSGRKHPNKKDWRTDPPSQKILKEFKATVMKRPAAARPTFSEKPTEYNGGRINFDKIRKRLRVYVKKTDKVEQTVTIYGESRAGKSEAFNFACATIDNGGRP